MRAFVWSFIGQFGNLIITIAGTIFLSRLLAPKDFGYMAMIMYWVNLAQTVNNFGIHHIIVLNKTIKKNELSTLFWFNLVLSLIFFLVFFFGAGLFGELYELEQVKTLSLALSFNFIIGAFLMVPQAMLHQQQKFKAQSIILLVSTLTGFCVAIVGAYLTGNYIFLAVQQLVTVGTNFILHFLVVKWMPAISFHFSYLRSNRKFGGNLFSVYFLEYLAQNLDTFIVGKASNEQVTGLYSRSSVFSILPVQNFTAAVSKVLLPRLRDLDPGSQDFNALYSHYFKIILATVSLLMLFLVSIDVYFIELFFGSQWLPMRDYFDLFCLIGIFTAVLSYIDIVLLSTKKSASLLVFIAIEKTLLVIFILGGYTFGIKGILLARLIFTVVVFAPKNIFMNKVLQVPLLHNMWDAVKILIVPILLGALSFLIKYSMPLSNYSMILPSIVLLWIAGFLFFDRQVMNNFYLNTIKNITRRKK